jgi:SAM-dependent methyltransferase
MDVFWELHSDIPREGPGDNASTRKAWSLLRGVPEQPRVLDVGCGPGMQTIELAKISGGSILAVDTHQPFLDELVRRAGREGLAGKISKLNRSMFELDLDAGGFDVIWSEGAIYIIGFEHGLSEWKRLLKPGGFAAVTELSWLRPDPPEEAAAYWGENYPGMAAVAANCASLRQVGYREIDHFTLPDSSWWDDYYAPLEERIATLAEKYRDDEEAMLLLHESQRECDMHRKYAEWYGYVFYVMQVQ